MGEHQEGSGHTEKHHYSQNPWGQEKELQSGNKLKVFFFFFFQDHLGHANKFRIKTTKLRWLQKNDVFAIPVTGDNTTFTA